MQQNADNHRSSHENEWYWSTDIHFIAITWWRLQMEATFAYLVSSGESTGHWRIPLTKGLWWSFNDIFDVSLNTQLKKTVESPMIWDASILIHRLLFLYPLHFTATNIPPGAVCFHPWYPLVTLHFMTVWRCFFAYLARQNDLKSLPFASATPFDCVGKEGSFQSRHLFDAPKRTNERLYTKCVVKEDWLWITPFVND